MIKKEEFLQVFKNECRHYFVYEAELKKERLDLEETENQIINLRSPITDRVGGHQTVSHEDQLVTLIEIKTETEYRIDYYESLLLWIKEVFQNITSPAYKALSWQTLIQGKTKTDILIYYDVDPSYVYKMRDKFLNVALNKDMYEKYQLIQEKKLKSKWLSKNKE